MATQSKYSFEIIGPEVAHYKIGYQVGNKGIVSPFWSLTMFLAGDA